MANNWMIGLADCNNFFVSCERSVHPELQGKAVVVMSNNDGCVVARSNEAKRLGIKMGQPVFQIRDMVRSGKVIAISGHHTLYKKISVAVHDIFRRYAPRTLDYSVDEAFLDMEGIPMQYLEDIGEKIYTECLEQVGIPVTIGFATTKTLAKIATETGKAAGVHVRMLSDPEETARLLAEMPINELWGIGRRIAKKLYLAGVYTIGQFADRNLAWVRSLLGVNGERSWLELHGTQCIELSHVDKEIQQSISESRTFPKDIDNYDYIRTRISMYAEHCAARLRRMNGMCRKVGVLLCTNRFSETVPPRSLWMEAEFNEYVASLTPIVTAALASLDKIYDPRLKYKRGGVFIGDVVPCCELTGSLFDDEQVEVFPESHRRLLEAVDRINASTESGVLMSLAGSWTGRLPKNNDGYSSSFQFRD